MGRLLGRALGRTATIAILVAVASTLVGVAAYAYAVDSPEPQTIYAAVNMSSGAMKIVDASYQPKANEYILTWNSIGPQGPAGPQGEPGAAGAQGEKGDKGDAGADGTQWFTGLVEPSPALGGDGDLYLMGDGSVYQKTGGSWVFFTTLKGPQGDPGPKGDAGDVGPAGPKGDAGEAGPAGAPGEKGGVGPMGPAGPKGDKGDPGDIGPAGPRGPVGDVSNDPAYAKWIAFAPFVTVDNGTVAGFEGPNVVFSGANLLRATGAGDYVLLGGSQVTVPQAPSTPTAELVAPAPDYQPAALVTWQASIQPGLQGYRVYRREVFEDTPGTTYGPWVKLADVAVGDPLQYTDVLPGRGLWEYALTCVHVSGGESTMTLARGWVGWTGVVNLKWSQSRYSATGNSATLQLLAVDEDDQLVTDFNGEAAFYSGPPTVSAGFIVSAMDPRFESGIANVVVTRLDPTKTECTVTGPLYDAWSFRAIATVTFVTIPGTPVDHLAFVPQVPGPLLYPLGVEDGVTVTVQAVDSNGAIVEGFEGVLSCSVTTGDYVCAQPDVIATAGQATFTFHRLLLPGPSLRFLVSCDVGTWEAYYDVVST